MNLQSSNSQKAFTLLELLVVMAIVLILLSLTTAAITGSLRANQLSSALSRISADLAYGPQFAVRENWPVEFRLYELPEAEGLGGDAFRAYQFLARDPDTAMMEPLGNLLRLDGEVVVLPDPQFSTLLDLGIESSGPGDPDIAGGAGYRYLSFQFRPDGTTTLPKDRAWCLTLVSELTFDGTLPPNYRTLVINAITGGVTSY